MEPVTNLFVVKIARGSSKELLKEYLGRRCRMEYVATHNFTIYVHHAYQHGYIMDSEGVRHQDVMMRGRVKPDPDSHSAIIDIQGGVELPAGCFPECEVDNQDPFDIFSKDPFFEQREELSKRFREAIVYTLVAFLQELGGDLAFCSLGKVIEIPSY